MAELHPQGAPPTPPPGEQPSSRNLKATGRGELRRVLRFRIDDASAKLHIKGFLTSLGLGRVNKARAAVNLSEGGVLLLTREAIPAGTKVVVRIEMEKYSDFIQADGVVKWSAQGARSDQDYYAGIEFAGLSPADLKKIGQMREWFTSPEYKARSATRRRTAPPAIETQR